MTDLVQPAPASICPFAGRTHARQAMHTHLAQQAHHLAAGQRLFRLSLDAPERVASWTRLVLTASNPVQADLYRRQLGALRAQGRLPDALTATVVEDPDGARIGSGGATLNVLRRLAAAGADPAAGRTLLIHAGGDSKRLPWANAVGKIFVPFPLHAHPDYPVPTLLEHLLAVLAPLPPRLADNALVVASGDVLPLFDAATFVIAPDATTIAATPATLDIASRHGVVVPGAAGLVRDLLQKAGAAELAKHGAVSAGGMALIDTGLLAFCGLSLRRLVELACSSSDPVALLTAAGSEISVYEELLSGSLPARREWLAARPLGAACAAAFADVPLALAELPAFGFVHLGSNGEYLAHLAAPWDGAMTRRLLAEHGAMADATATVLASRIDPAARIGGGSAVVGARLGAQVGIGNRCMVFNAIADDLPLTLPDHACLWQVPLRGGAWATLCCGVDDNPKDDWLSATFLGHRLDRWLAARGLDPSLLWTEGEPRTLWTARLFPAGTGDQVAAGAAWLLDPAASDDADSPTAAMWCMAERVSMAGCAARFDAEALIARSQALGDALVLHRLSHAAATLADTALGPFAATLSAVHRPVLASLAARIPVSGRASVPISRRWRMRADLLAGAGLPEYARSAAEHAWEAVADEVDAAIEGLYAPAVSGLVPGTTAERSLPARFDLAGGWSDTPPFCIERPARVCNFAFTIAGRAPIGARATALAAARWELVISGLPPVIVSDAGGTVPEGGLADPYALPKLALQVAGFGSAQDGITQGVRLECWSDVPKGSGLGASSILAAAIMAALDACAGRADDTATVSSQVLAVEQALGTRGGWQDQLGGLVPGVKLLSSLPLRPLRVTIEPVALAAATATALQQRLVIAYTGISRLARDVLQRVVAGYLARDARVVSGTVRLAELAEESRIALARGDLDALGEVLGEVWHHHQQLDPHCSNPAVDALLAPIEHEALGWKLAGAGGGGFVGILARDVAAAERITAHLARCSGVKVANWALAG